MIQYRVLSAICTANDQGHRAASHNTKHPISNPYAEEDYNGLTNKAWQIGYDKERRRIAQSSPNRSEGPTSAYQQHVKETQDTISRTTHVPGKRDWRDQ